MQKLNLNFDEKDIEVEINGKVYGFDMTKEKVKAMADLQRVADSVEDEEEVIIAIEDAIDMIYGEGTIDSIFGEHETTRATLLKILEVTIEAVEDYGAKFGVETGTIKQPTANNSAKMNRAERRRAARKNK